VKKIKNERQRVYEEMRRIVRVFPSQANFLFFESPVGGLVEGMMKKGVILRDFSGIMGKNYVRVTIGRNDENNFFLKCLKELLEER
jgi:histidinol-phosphate aminotransferase